MSATSATTSSSNSASDSSSLGHSYSLADRYLVISYLWSRLIGLPVGDLPAHGVHLARVAARPAVQHAIAAADLPPVRAA